MSADGFGRSSAGRGALAGKASPWLLVLAPVGGVVLDWLVPAWSVLPLSVALCLIGSLPIAYISVTREVGTLRGFALRSRFLLGAALAPASLKSSLPRKAAAKYSALWLASLALSVVAVQAVATPANMSGLTKQISAGVQKQWNIDVDVRCPGPQVALPGQVLDCIASKRILIDIAVPAKVRVKNFFGQVTWNVSAR